MSQTSDTSLTPVRPLSLSTGNRTFIERDSVHEFSGTGLLSRYFAGCTSSTFMYFHSLKCFIVSVRAGLEHVAVIHENRESKHFWTALNEKISPV